MNRKQFMMSVGATCKNWQNSWSFVNHKERFIVFGAWLDSTNEDECLILDKNWKTPAGKKPPGRKQSVEHIRLIQEEGYALKVFQMEKDEEKRKSGFVGVKIGKIDPRLLDCELREEDGNFYATGIVDPLKEISSNQSRSQKPKKPGEFPHLVLGERIKNEKLREIFKCSTQGGMRRAKKTNSLVLISNHHESIYDDRWTGQILHYTGQGSSGHQSLEFMQNKTLSELPVNNVAAYLFEVYGPKGSDYVYRGRVELDDRPYQEKQRGDDNKVRNVWVFPLKAIDCDAQPVVEAVDIASVKKSHQRIAKKLSVSELKRMAQATSGGSQKSTTRVVSNTRDTSVYVSDYARQRADGVCELCEEPAPFLKKNREPFLEVHHIKWLSKEGIGRY